MFSSDPELVGPCRSLTVSSTQRVEAVHVLPVAARTAITICAHGVNCPHPAPCFTRVRGRRGTDSPLRGSQR